MESQKAKETKTPLATKELIFQTAARRFSHYGYCKTTIADIAADCRMSPGNLYRFFDNKIDIAAAIARDITARTVRDLERRIKRAGSSSLEQLRAFLFGDLHITYRTFEDNPKMIEMAQMLKQARPDTVKEQKRARYKLLKSILEKGKNSGEFAIDCADSACDGIQNAAMRFQYPHLTSPQARLPDLDRRLESVFNLISSALTAGCRFIKPKETLPQTSHARALAAPFLSSPAKN